MRHSITMLVGTVLSIFAFCCDAMRQMTNHKRELRKEYFKPAVETKEGLSHLRTLPALEKVSIMEAKGPLQPTPPEEMNDFFRALSSNNSKGNIRKGTKRSGPIYLSFAQPKKKKKVTKQTTYVMDLNQVPSAGYIPSTNQKSFANAPQQQSHVLQEGVDFPPGFGPQQPPQQDDADVTTSQLTQDENRDDDYPPTPPYRPLTFQNEKGEYLLHPPAAGQHEERSSHTK